jgi:amino acid transporter
LPRANRIIAGRKMRLLPLIAATYFMVSGGPYGLEDIIGKAGYSRAILILLLVPLFWSLPTSLMIGELAAAIPSEGGFYAWVHRAMGPFWGFQEAWLSLAASVFDMAIYPTTFVLYLSHIAPSFTAGYRGWALKLAIVLISAVWNLRGAAAVGIGSVRMMIISLSPFVVLIALALWHGLHTSLGPASGNAPASVDLSGAILVALWNYMGWDNASTVAQEVEDPQHTYPRAILWSALAVMCVYTLPLLAVWFTGIPADRFSTGAWVDAAGLLGGSTLALAVVLAGSLDGLGTFNALTLSLTRLPYAMALDGLAPAIFARRLANGVPWVSVIACSIGWALALGFSFERLISIDLILYGGALLLEFVALVVLRLREPALARPFRVPGGLVGTIACGTGPVLLIGFAIWAARAERVAGLPALIFAVLVAAVGPAVYALTRRGQIALSSR